MLLADDSEIIGFANLLHICKYEDIGVQCYWRMHSVKATALPWPVENLKIKMLKAYKK